MSNALIPAARPVRATFTVTLAELARSVAGLFAVTTHCERERLLHRLVLAVILSVGALLRFSGLGDVGLHGDEDTMALAAMHILQDGRPILPSGLFYPRGFTQLYLMALSALVFGPTEWALRLPSALCGIALIALAYVAGRRFLRPQWNLAFAATIALLPEMIQYSQTARMYIFMLAAIAAAMACIFAWERSERPGWLIGAVVALVVGIELHALAVSVSLLLLLPGILQGDVRKLAYGLGATGVVLVGYLAIDGWVNAQYPIPPPQYGADIAAPGWRGSRALNYPAEFDIAMLVASAAAAFFAVHLGHKVPHRTAALAATVLLLAGLVAQVTLFYHLAALLYVAALVIAYRHTGAVVLRRSWMFTLSAGVIALLQVTVLAARPGSLVKLVGALVGQPSVWPYVRISSFSVFATLLALAATLWALWRIANRRRADDYCLLALLGVWVPLFALGLFVWDMPPRYAAASVPPLLLSAFAFAQRAVHWLTQALWSARAVQVARAAAALLAAALMINPLNAAQRINSGYARYPDHKGAADFMRTQRIVPQDIVVAEDPQQQVYYFGPVDYWLMSRKHARRFVHEVNREIRDFYTGSLVIDSGEALAQLLERHPERRIFIVGSGENRRDERRELRGFGIFEMLESDRFEVLFVGRDGFTKVWRARARPGAQPTVAPLERSRDTLERAGAPQQLDARGASADME